jgi:hypothetical protein
MSDIRIKISSVKKEALIWVILVLAGFLMNVYAIILYDGKWSELYSQLHIVLLLSVVLYVFIALIRGGIHIIKYIISRWAIRS